MVGVFLFLAYPHLTERCGPLTGRERGFQGRICRGGAAVVRVSRLCRPPEAHAGYVAFERRGIFFRRAPSRAQEGAHETHVSGQARHGEKLG